MARVISRVSATSLPGDSRRGSAPQSDLYPSLNTLRSVQEEEDKERGKSCGEWCKKVSETIYNFTIASCECFSWCKWSSQGRRGYHRTQSTASSTEDVEIAYMKEKIHFHFMNPFQKWKYPRKRRFPWKLLVQLASIVLVTIQLSLYAGNKAALTTFILDNQATFAQLFVKELPKDYDSDDPLPSPISVLYTHDHLKNQVEYTINQYFTLDAMALGTYGYNWMKQGEAEAEVESPQIELAIKMYDQSSIKPAKKTFFVSSSTHENLTMIYNANETLDWEGIMTDLSRIVQLSMRFNITTIFVQPDGRSFIAECFQFRLEFVIENKLPRGTMPLTLHVDQDISKCNNDTSIPLETENAIFPSSLTTVLDVIVILTAVISILQCLRSFVKSWRLSREVSAFFANKFLYRLKCHQLLPLYNMWFLLVIVSNLLVVVGSILKLLIAYNFINSLTLIDLTSIIIGLAVFGQWGGLLRFLSYFDKYNMLLITLRLSMPSVIRFIICTGILYIAFLLCGWLVFGPYHNKFRDPFVTSECLFSLINGDDMFATYKEMSQASTAAYVFSKIYLYVFIALFIYVVLSVFISLISDTYETLHEHWYERSKGLLADFASGKLGKPHYHSGPAGHAHAHPEMHHDDQTEEEDYEYLREASCRFGPNVGEVRPLMCNGGPELRQSDSERSSPYLSVAEPRSGPYVSQDGGGGARAAGMQQQQQQKFTNHVQIQNYAAPHGVSGQHL